MSQLEITTFLATKYHATYKFLAAKYLIKLCDFSIISKCFTEDIHEVRIYW